MAEVKIRHPYVTQKRGVQGGRPIITGTRIPVSTIIIYYKQGKDVDEILELYPQLTPAQVHDALSYYHDYQEEIEKEVALLQDEARWQRRYPPGKGQPARADEPNPD
jgi:uncharacterized protein (DUF433 family)